MYDDRKISVIKDWLGVGSINIFGLPFAGKDIQGEILAKIFNGNLLGGGEILRSVTLPVNIKECLQIGKLIPSEDYVKIVLPYLKKPSLAGKPLILSSFGRWSGEEMGVLTAVKESGHPLKSVVYLKINENDAHKRWLMLRENNDRKERRDDAEEILKTRFSEFKEKTKPVIDFYNDLELLIEINGKGTREQVTNNIINSLFEKCQK